ncbi:hypothetical protein DPMN_087039 [Dreissena polymorpha]|uniref:Uncharacterized protein n=1 Tax=Dreissena polymorpha TaxID=45954 RepID=A0A9D4KRI2_DREPO|nr:hypothetical protein DPMN_087039 [Dreissena polymorpha]
MRTQMKALEQVTSWLIGQLATLEELLQFLRLQKLFVNSDNSKISSGQVENMRQFCSYLGVAAPERFTLAPPNSVAILLHWKILLVISARLHKDEHNFWRSAYPLLEGYDAEPDDEEMVFPKIPVAVDSHLHPDRLACKAALSAECTLYEVLNAGLVRAEQRVQVKGGVAVYCNPETYSTVDKMATFPKIIPVVVGVHP